MEGSTSFVFAHAWRGGKNQDILDLPVGLAFPASSALGLCWSSIEAVCQSIACGPCTLGLGLVGDEHARGTSVALFSQKSRCSVSWMLPCYRVVSLK